MYQVEDVRHVIADLTNSSLVVSPWLAYVGGRVRFDSCISDMLYWGTRDFTQAHWRREYLTKAFGTLPVHSRFPRTAVFETAASTAAFLAYEQTGRPSVTERHATDALHVTEDFILQHGFDYFLSSYVMLTMYENHNALNYYGQMREGDFLSGRLHRPWVDYELDDELILSCELGTAELFVDSGERFVRLTTKGRDRLSDYYALLKETGYLDKRNRSLRISHFSEMEDYDSVVQQIAPTAGDLRRSFLDFTTIQPGMRVLEIGCGSGSFTFDAGLVDLVGPNGSVVATDPAPRMLERAMMKRDPHDVPWLDFVQAPAENLPFPDGSFDAVVNMLAMHLTDIPTAVKEMHRVLKPGGIVASFHPLDFPMANSIVQEWFRPVSSLVQQPKRETTMPEKSTVPDAVAPYFRDVVCQETSTPNYYTNPDIVTRFYLESVGLFDDHLTRIPWAERTRLIEETRNNGRRLCSMHTTEELTVEYPVQMLRGIARDLNASPKGCA
ncbi:methyltransferase domain-containing protein [Alicyclobacillus fastidiosus]|uniref:Methyltransferase domain-containing protein n=2 Tax=Alicyclobacillus fastidiosus TaxID=392011 RepID=A0ABY6ZIB0_9BACL|nr:class I SAM-dependent methyltransferase [Alicyclobacillus fastidiosus]WAH42617.1 methyltransferase domain-containing protein [Alicyclobacillus fastidiosus]